MGTSNFYLQEDFPLYGASEEEWDFEGSWDYLDEEFTQAMDAADIKFRRILRFYDIELRGGYYEGVQLFVKEKEWDSIYWLWDNHGKQADRMKSWETAFIAKKLLPFIAKYMGFYEVYQAARFSNGETWYKRAS